MTRRGRRSLMCAGSIPKPAFAPSTQVRESPVLVFVCSTCKLCGGHAHLYLLFFFPRHDRFQLHRKLRQYHHLHRRRQGSPALSRAGLWIHLRSFAPRFGPFTPSELRPPLLPLHAVCSLIKLRSLRVDIKATYFAVLRVGARH